MARSLRTLAGMRSNLRRNAGELAPALLAHLRDALDLPDLSYETGPDPIAMGVETWVFGLELRGAPQELDGPLVLRLFPAESDPLQARFEQVVQNMLSDMGQPVPRVGHLCGDLTVLGGTFLIMERMPGRMMLDSILDGSNVLLNAPRLIAESLTQVPQKLAEAQLRVQGLDPAPLERALESARIPSRMYTVGGRLDNVKRRVDDAGLEGLRPGLAWLREQRPPQPERPVICHCDFLPPNLLVENGELSGIVDWSRATLADPAWDFANTRLRMAMNPVDLPRLLAPIVPPLRRRMTRAYEDAYRTGRDLDPVCVAYYEVLLSIWMLVTVGEHRVSPRPDVSDGRSPNLWLRKGAERPLLDLCREIAGLELSLPSPRHAS